MGELELDPCACEGGGSGERLQAVFVVFAWLICLTVVIYVDGPMPPLVDVAGSALLRPRSWTRIARGHWLNPASADKCCRINV